MTRIQRRLLIDTSVIGITLTLFVAILDYSSRVLQPLDDWFYDRRARLCQFSSPPVTDKLVHLDIDDASLEAVGKWPWPRAHLAEMIEEIDRAGATAISTDIIFSEPSEPRYQKLGPGKFREIDDDALFTAALRRSGKCLVPVSFDIYQNPPASYTRLREYLTADLELNEGQCYQRLLGEPGGVLPPGAKFPVDQYVVARRDAMKARLAKELEGGEVPLDELRRRLLPRTDPGITGSPLLRLLADEHRRVLAIAQLQRLVLPIPPGLPPLPRFERELVPILPFAQAAPLSGYVNYLQTGEGGVIRAIPLFAEYRGKLFPQSDIVLACAVLGVDLRSLRLHPDRVVIPKPPGRTRDIVIPVRNTFVPQFGRELGMFMDVPDRGRRDWETLYDPDHREPRLHLPLAAVWEVHTIRQRIQQNNANIDKAISTILADDAPHKLALDPDRAKKYAASVPSPEDTAARREIVEWTRAQLRESGLLDLAKLTDAELKDKPEQRVQRDELVAASNALGSLLDANGRFADQLATRRAQLKEKINGRAALIGYVATGGIDAYPTTIHPSCPGVVIHGLAFNAIMTEDFWRHAPKWVTVLITLGLGLIVTAANGFLKPAAALLVALLLGVAYLLINGLLLFDRAGIVVGVAGPMAALATVWSTGALAGFLIEAAERARITRRFSSYVDQKIVDYVIENPDAALDGQVREMSVIFTDLAGFTTLSEQLRERSVGMLSDYLGLMVPVIRKHDGVLNKFLGDGIMCFFNAPYDDPDHAVHAVQTVLEMQKTMETFAAAMAEQGLSGLSMRCGVSSGKMVVGDSGPADYQDYTVLGDAVNFAARLEGANKSTGTNILISQRTSELLGDRFLLRPVGRLLVVGKTQGLMTYEPLATIDEATPEHLMLCATSAEMMAAYVARDFARCIRVADQMDAQLGPGKLSALYRRSSQEYLVNPPGAEFEGNLVITEK
jgi:class 3 adenylate cyclase/CHASE2 domain-containing sensor protein